jgi:hypothetical protein
MRALLKVLAILVPTLFLSTAAAVAQTGEFTAVIPGEVIHRGYALQDEWQKTAKRSGEPARQHSAEIKAV